MSIYALALLQIIISLTEKALRKLISKVRNILDSQLGSPVPSSQHPRSVSSSGVPLNLNTRRTENITSRTGARHFDSFLQSINKCNSLLDARRLKNDMVGEIRRTRILLGTFSSRYARQVAG